MNTPKKKRRDSHLYKSQRDIMATGWSVSRDGGRINHGRSRYAIL